VRAPPHRELKIAAPVQLCNVVVKGCQQFLQAPLQLGSYGICNFDSLFHLAKHAFSVHFAGVAVMPFQQLPPITFAVSPAGVPWHTIQDQYHGVS